MGVVVKYCSSSCCSIHSRSCSSSINGINSTAVAAPAVVVVVVYCYARTALVGDHICVVVRTVVVLQFVTAVVGIHRVVVVVDIC